METLDSDRLGSASPHITAVGGGLQYPSTFPHILSHSVPPMLLPSLLSMPLHQQQQQQLQQQQQQQQHVIRPTTAAINSLRKRSVSMNSNSSVTAAHRMSIISLGSPRNSIVSVDDFLRTTTRNNSCTSLNSISSPAATPAPVSTTAVTGPATSTVPKAKVTSNPLPTSAPPLSAPAAASINNCSVSGPAYVPTSSSSALVSDDEDTEILLTRNHHLRNIKNFRLKDDFQFKYDPPVSPPPQPPHFHKLSSPLADSPLDAGVSLLPHVSHDLIKVEPNIPMSSDSTHKKSKQHSIKSSVTASFLKKKNLFSKDLQLEISNRYKRDYSETRFVRTPGSADNAANSQETTTTNTKERILNSIIPSKEENHIAPAASTPPSSTSVPNSTTTTQEQISLLTKLNRKWNKASVLESLPGTTKNINQNNNSKPRKRSRALLESDTEDYDLND